jgi:hypothetical protein
MYVLGQLHTYPITEKAKEVEKNTMKNILRNNEYDIKLISKLHSQKKTKQNRNVDLQHQKTKWVTFTYNSKEVRAITKLFRDTKIKMAFHMQNTVQNILRPRPQQDKYSRSGI